LGVAALATLARSGSNVAGSIKAGELLKRRVPDISIVYQKGQNSIRESKGEVKLFDSDRGQCYTRRTCNKTFIMEETMRPKFLSMWLWLYLLVLSLFLVGCGGAAQPAAAPAEPKEATPAQEAAKPAEAEKPAPSGDKPAIKLAENPWTGSSINVNVAKILLEKELGYKVEIVTIDENAQWPALATGDLSASLEVWPSGHAENVKQYIDEQKVVENGGELGVVGKIGWFIPKYMVDEHPELATWEGFKNPELAALFKTAETGEQGQFLGGDPSWVQYDEQIIKNLGLNFKVVYAGSEQAILAAVDAAYSRKSPVLIYFYKPHSAFAKYDLVNVTLPEHTEACYEKAESGGVDCDYPTDILFKVVWSDLKNKAPEAYQLLTKMNYSTDDQVSMIADVDTNGKTPEQAAQAWIDKNEAKWKAWLP
jgi:glycine betaine/proline transport system substrate-binding protein